MLPRTRVATILEGIGLVRYPQAVNTWFRLEAARAVAAFLGRRLGWDEARLAQEMVLYEAAAARLAPV